MRTSSRVEPAAAGGGGEASANSGMAQRLSELQQLNSRDLRTEWRRLLRSNPPNLSRDLLVRAIAYRVQELAHGGLPNATARKLANLGTEFARDGQISVEARPQIKPGARLVREWRGRTHVVTVTDEGFSYGSRTYPSLTSIAQEITGAHWSGPRFFGLVRRLGDEPTAKPRRASVEACHGQA
jgi:hypothetical protein